MADESEKRLKLPQPIDIRLDKAIDSSTHSLATTWRPLCALLMACIATAMMIGSTFAAQPKAKEEPKLAKGEAALKSRYLAYSYFMQQRDYRAAYHYVSPKTKEGISREEWTQRWKNRIVRQVSESYKSSTISSDGLKATIISVVSIDKKEERLNLQTWVKVEGIWGRAFLEDSPTDF